MNRAYAALAGLTTGTAAVGLAAAMGVMPNPFASQPTALATALEADAPPAPDTSGSDTPVITAMAPPDATDAEPAETDPQADLRARLEEAMTREAALETERMRLEDQVAGLAELERALRDSTAALAAEAEDLSARSAEIAAREDALSQRELDLDQRVAALVAQQLQDVPASSSPTTPMAPEIEARHGELAPNIDGPPSRDDTVEFAALPAEEAGPGDAAAAEPAAEPSAEADRKPRSFADGPLAEVHFERNSAKLTPGGLIRAREAAEKVAEMNVAKIRIVGLTDRSGPEALNKRLSQARAEAVAEIFVETGLSRRVIEVVGMGEAHYLLPISTEDGISEPLNRCVGILVEEAAAL